jgi:hypothetical protein
VRARSSGASTRRAARASKSGGSSAASAASAAGGGSLALAIASSEYTHVPDDSPPLASALARPAVVRDFIDGAPCDVRGGQPRRGRVRFVCLESGSARSNSALTAEANLGSATMSLLGFEEAPTCE